MARRPRHVVPGQALHLIQRGNNRQAIFFADEDYQFYYEALQDAAKPLSMCRTCICLHDQSCALAVDSL